MTTILIMLLAFLRWHPITGSAVQYLDAKDPYQNWSYCPIYGTLLEFLWLYMLSNVYSILSKKYMLFGGDLFM